ncbi:MAG: lipid II flippase MurJ, partial [Acidimicrobiales bacterium]
ANRRTGDVTVWVTAYTFFQLPVGIAAVSLMSAIQPALADSWARHRLVAFRRRMAGGLRGILSLVIPAAVGYLLLARPALELVLRHGATTTAGADRAAVATALLALGLPGFCVFLLLVRTYQAMKDARTPFLLYLLENTINVVGAVALFPSLGVRGLALSVSIAYTVAAVVALVSLRRRLEGIEGRRLLSHLGRVGVPTLVMAIGVALVGAVITGQSTGVLAGRVALAVAVGGAAYLATAGLMAGVMARGRAA